MMSDPETLTLPDLILRYTETQGSTLEEISHRLDIQLDNLDPDGWMLLECVQLDSSFLGSRVILPYGKLCTFKFPPTTPVSPRGMASDMSAVIAISPRVRSSEVRAPGS